MFYLQFVFMFGSSLSPVVCRTAHVLFTLCSVRLYLHLFVGGLMSYLRYVRCFVMFASSLPPVVCRRARYVLFRRALVLFTYVRCSSLPVCRRAHVLFVCRTALVLFTLCSVRLYLQLFVERLMSYLRYVRFVFISSCL